MRLFNFVIEGKTFTATDTSTTGASIGDASSTIALVELPTNIISVAAATLRDSANTTAGPHAGFNLSQDAALGNPPAFNSTVSAVPETVGTDSAPKLSADILLLTNKVFEG